jgi:Probable sensor domain DACNV
LEAAALWLRTASISYYISFSMPPSGSRSITPPSYPAGRAAAERIRHHFAQHIFAAHRAGEVAAVPDAASVEFIIEAAFWASLRREEGITPRISLAFVAPDAVKRPLTFEQRLPLAAEPLTRLAPAVERPGIHLGVWREDEGFFVWGTTRRLPPFCLVLEVVAPGLLVVKHSRGDESEKFVNVAVLQGDQIKVIDEESARLPDCPELLTSLLGFDTQDASSESVSPLIHLAISMRAHGRGGSLLVVPAASGLWRDSIAQPVSYAVVPPFSALADLMRRHASGDQGPEWVDALRRVVDVVGGLTAVDGATVMTDGYEVLAFGAKIVRRRGSQQVARVIATEPIEGVRAEVVDPGQLGGTRHLSAAQFVNDQRDALALIASQDGRFTVFAWSPCDDMVHAHRIEALLL